MTGFSFRLLLLAGLGVLGAGVGAAEPGPAPPPADWLEIAVIPDPPGTNANWRQVEVRAQSRSDQSVTATITGTIAPPVLLKPASRTLRLEPRQLAVLKFRVYNPTGQWRGIEAPGFSVSARSGNSEFNMRADAPWPQATADRPAFHWPSPGWLTAVVLAIGLVLLLPAARAALSGALASITRPVNAVELLVLLAVTAFIVVHLSPEHLLTSTTTTGGDTASHFYTLYYLRNVLLPHGQISGWTPGNYAGFPILQFYFPLVFLFMSFLSGIMSLEVAFKVGTILGSLLLPFGAWGMLRLIRVPFPGPAIGAVLTLPFLFNADNSMWGGNILSTLAGEFSYSLSLAISLIALGSLYRGAIENKHVVLNAILVFLVGFSHGYTLLFVVAMSAYLVITPHGFVRRLFYLGKVYVLAFCLLAFWIVPLLVFTSFTTSYNAAWTIGTTESLVPVLLAPMLLAGLFGSIGLVVWGIRQIPDIGEPMLHSLGYLWFGLFMCLVFFVAAPRLGVVDIRYIPIAYLLLCLLASMSLGWLGWQFERWRIDWAVLALAVVAVFAWTGNRPGPATGWAKWNYEGFENKSTWNTFEAINDALRGDFSDPRVVYEHAAENNTFGSTRAFESLPLFSGRATLEGLYMQASISAPFVFYVQSEVSHLKSAPFLQYSYSSMDFDQARAHLELFNVRDLIIRSDFAKKAIRQASGYRLQNAIGNYELWRLETGDGQYVVPLKNEPVLLPTDTWKQKAFWWFTNQDLLDTQLVFGPPKQVGEDSPIRVVATDSSRIRKVPLPASDCTADARVGNEDIDITTNCIGRPLLVKMSYHPNWHVTGADRIYPASPSFMLIYPNQSKVRLYYGPGKWDRIGDALTLLALFILLINIPWGKSRVTFWQRFCWKTGVRASLTPEISLELSERTRLRILVVAVLTGALLLSWWAYRVYQSDVHRTFNTSVRLKDQQEYEEARKGFEYVLEQLPSSGLGQTSIYYIAITYYLANDCEHAIHSFRDLIARFPKGNWVPEAKYHIGLCLFKQGHEIEGINQMQALRREHPGTQWAEYAAARLQEHHSD
ncbi:MAG: 6-pyruvoyl-tetrahydropterin synthase-related protein [Halieaceae bacterium]|jgi:tetratricopeptide (TPR) repeat protein|nr:6-pyruvoyl-tetrahydropterin synthase-related protein [Halieaceae bacterium]